MPCTRVAQERSRRLREEVWLHWVLTLLDLDRALENGRLEPCRLQGQEQKAALGERVNDTGKMDCQSLLTSLGQRDKTGGKGHLMPLKCQPANLSSVSQKPDPRGKRTMANWHHVVLVAEG